MARSRDDAERLIGLVEAALKVAALSPTDRRRAVVALGNAKTVFDWGQYDRAWNYAAEAAAIVENS